MVGFFLLLVRNTIFRVTIADTLYLVTIVQEALSCWLFRLLTLSVASSRLVVECATSNPIQSNAGMKKTSIGENIYSLRFSILTLALEASTSVHMLKIALTVQQASMVAFFKAKIVAESACKDLIVRIFSMRTRLG